VSEFGHAAEFCLGEYWSVVADKVGSYYTGGADSHPTLEHPFQAYLNVATGFHCEVVDFLHHRLGAACVDRIKTTNPENGFSDLGNLVLLPIGPIIGCENELEVVFLAVGYQPVFEEELAGSSRPCDKSHIPSAEVN